MGPARRADRAAVRRAVRGPHDAAPSSLAAECAVELLAPERPAPCSWPVDPRIVATLERLGHHGVAVPLALLYQIRGTVRGRPGAARPPPGELVGAVAHRAPDLAPGETVELTPYARALRTVGLFILSVGSKGLRSQARAVFAWGDATRPCPLLHVLPWSGEAVAAMGWWHRLEAAAGDDMAASAAPGAPWRGALLNMWSHGHRELRRCHAAYRREGAHASWRTVLGCAVDQAIHGCPTAVGPYVRVTHLPLGVVCGMGLEDEEWRSAIALAVDPRPRSVVVADLQDLYVTSRPNATVVFISDTAGARAIGSWSYYPEDSAEVLLPPATWSFCRLGDGVASAELAVTDAQCSG